MIKKIYGLIALCAILFAGSAHAYDMPIGIPAPNFGSALGNPVTVALPSKPSGWPSQEVAGYYYVDNTSGNATDSSNTYGYPNKPRKSIPSSLSAGSVVEIHGGPYNYSENFDIAMNGTATAPVFVYGVGNPAVYAIRTNITGSYFVFDGLKLSESRIIATGVRYGTIRNTEVHGPNQQNGVSLNGNNIVFYNNNVHHHQGDDKHGVTITQGSSTVWILNNWLHHNGGDGIQFCHQCSAAPPDTVYIGGNTMNGNRENGIDLKYGKHIVVSQNEVYNHWTATAGVEFCYDDNSGCTVGSSGSDGASIVVGSDGAPSDVWVIFNHVYDSNKGIRVEEAYDGVILGNVIHDVNSIGIEFEKAGEGPIDVEFNTVYNTNTGIKGPWQGGVLKLTINNNVIAKISGSSINIDEAASYSSASNNLFYNDGGSITIDWRTIASLTSGSAIDSKVGGSGNQIGNPLFKSPGSAEFATLSGGAGIDKANSDLVNLNTRFRDLFGTSVSVLRDYNNDARAVSGVGHDIGAYESDGTSLKAPPSAPSLIE